MPRTERSLVSAMCGVQLKDRIRTKHFMLSLNEKIDQSAIVHSGR